MRRRSLWALWSALLVICACAAYAQDGVEATLNRLIEASKNYELAEWRWIPGDVAGAEKAKFDDSAWRVGTPEFDTGPQVTTWCRKVVTIPESIGGVPVSGSRVSLVAGVDDDGECYVNGELKQSFHWDQCRVVLSEKAQPGDKFVVAIKATNGPGDGRLMFAELESGSATEWRARMNAVIGDLSMAKSLIRDETDASKKAAYTTCLESAVNAIDLKAVETRDAAAFDASMAKYRKALEPVGAAMKEYVVHLIGHAHIDMNWLWLWPETVDVCRNTFSTMLKIMDDYPDFRFSQSQASTYYAMEQLYPDLFAKIQKAVKEGRWEITGGTWVEGDMNMASGESIVRQIMYAKRYFKEKFGVEPEICWEPDTFGHAWSVPQILVKSGLKYYYFMRCNKDQNVFWWEGIDGSRVLAYTRGSYNESVGPHIVGAPKDVYAKTGVKDGMIVYGVGDHGGGPTRADLANAKQFQNQSVFPTVKFDTTKGFYTSLLKQKKDWPVIKDELNFIFQGCYTTHGELKKQNRISENLLPTAEAFSALAGDFGFTYPTSNFVDAWRNTCFNQFHDILDGSAIHGSYAYSTELFNKAYGVGKSALDGSTRAIAQNVDTSGSGTPVVVFNPLSWARTDTVQVEVKGAQQGLYVCDSRGSVMPSDVIDGKVVFSAADVPSLGYKVFYVRRGDKAAKADVIVSGDTLENEFYRVRVDSKSGAVVSVYDKSAGREVLPEGAKADQLQVLYERPHGMSAWDIGPISRSEDLSTAVSVEPVTDGKSMAAIRVKHAFGKSWISQDIMLYSGVKRIDFKVTADWREIGTPSTDAPMLKVAFPVDVKDGKARFETPFASIERPANGHEVPGQKWIDLSGDGYGVSLLNDCKYGHDVNGNVMRLTLLRSPYEPDPIPDVGRHEFTYSLYPHAGNWVKADTVRKGYELNNPLIGVVATNHIGRLPASRSFVKVEPSNVIVTALKKAEDGDDLILRFYESTGAPVKAKITFGTGVKTVQESDLSERAISGVTRLAGSSTNVSLGKWEIKTLKLGVD